MKILLLNWRDTKNPKSGGAEIVTMEHAKAWVKAGHEVTWLTSSFSGAKSEEIIEGIKIVRKGTPLGLYFLNPLFYFTKRKEVDIVVDQIHGLPYLTPLYIKKPIIVFIHEVAREIWDYMYNFPFNVIGKVLEPLTFLPYNNISFITVSNSSKQDLMLLGIKEKKIHVILNGLNIKPLDEITEKEKSLTFIFVSRLVPMKGIEEVIKAFSFIWQQREDAQLWIVGVGEKQYTEELRQIGLRYGIGSKIKFYGQVTDEKKIDLLKKSHLLLHASVKEGWGLVVIEAASQATPAVVYNVAGLRDSVKNGITGVVLKENSPREMAKQALMLLKDQKKYKKFQENALSWASSLTWEKSTKQSLDLIKQSCT